MALYLCSELTPSFLISIRSGKSRRRVVSNSSGRKNGTKTATTTTKNGGHSEAEAEDVSSEEEEDDDDDEEEKKEGASLALSGKLAEDSNSAKGVEVKYTEPPEARVPKIKWRLYPFKGEEEPGIGETFFSSFTCFSSFFPLSFLLFPTFSFHSPDIIFCAFPCLFLSLSLPSFSFFVVV